MKIPTVNRFLYFFDLTTGGLVLGYVGAVTNAAFALVLLFDLVNDIEKFKNDVFEFAEDVEELSPAEMVIDDFVSPDPIAKYELPTWVFVLLASTLLGVLVVCCLVSLWFIQGIKDRDPRKVRYFLVIMAIGTCSSFLKGALGLSFSWICIAMANVYFFIIVYSLNQILESEWSEQGASDTRGYTQHYDTGYQTTDFNRP